MTTAAIEVPAQEAPDLATGEVRFIGNATTLIRYGGFTILTDPTFLHQGEHVHLGHGTYARREVEPACQVSDLPPLHMIVLSHYHGDHFDEVAARELDKNVPIVTNDYAVGQLRQDGFTQGHAIDTWEAQDVVKGEVNLRVTSMPGKHAPDHIGDLLPPVMGSMLDFYRGENHVFRLYITGDTLLHDRLYDIPRWYPNIDLALVHAGGTTLLGTVVTMTGEQALRVVEIVRPGTAIPIHYNDYSVFLSGLDDFQNAAAKSSVSTEFHYLSHGETYRFRPTSQWLRSFGRRRGGAPPDNVRSLQGQCGDQVARAIPASRTQVKLMKIVNLRPIPGGNQVYRLEDGAEEPQ